MSAGNWVIYNDAIAKFLKKVDDYTADVFKVAIVTSSSNAIDKALVGAIYSSLTNELATAAGYTSGGATAGSPTVAGGGATATITFDTANVSWTGSGGGFTGRAAVLYDSTTGDLVAYCLLDSTPANVIVAAGVTLTITIANVFSMA